MRKRNGRDNWVIRHLSDRVFNNNRLLFGLYVPYNDMNHDDLIMPYKVMRHLIKHDFIFIANCHSLEFVKHNIDPDQDVFVVASTEDDVKSIRKRGGKMLFSVNYDCKSIGINDCDLVFSVDSKEFGNDLSYFIKRCKYERN